MALSVCLSDFRLKLEVKSREEVLEGVRRIFLKASGSGISQVPSHQRPCQERMESYAPSFAAEIHYGNQMTLQ